MLVYACSDNVQQTGTETLPGAEITAAPHFGDAPLTVEFSGEGSYLPGSSELTYTWNFDDFDDSGIASEGMTAEHTFDSPGTYVVTLTVSGSGGGTDTSSVIIIVN